jgi:hypothetical protein
MLDKKNQTHNNQRLKLRQEIIDLTLTTISLLIKEKTPRITRVIDNKDQTKILLITEHTTKRVELVECN